MYTFIRKRLKLLIKKKPKLLCDETRREETFNLGNLPFLVFSEVIRSMDITEIIKLAITSKKMENWVKMAYIKIPLYRIHARNQLSNIEIGDPLDVTMFCGSEKFEVDRKFTRNELSKYCDQLFVTKNLINVFKRLQYFLPSKDIDLILYKSHIEKGEVKEVLLNPAFQNYNSLYVMGGKVKSKDLKYIMETAKADITLTLLGTKVPIDFRCAQAFKFRNIQYDDARWVQLRNIFSLRNSKLVKLGKNTLNFTEFNSLLKYWMNSDVDMFQKLYIDKGEGDLNTILDGLVLLESSRFGGWSYFIAAKPSEKRKRTILRINFTSTSISLTAWAPDEPLLEDGRMDYKLVEELEILRLLERKEELAKELMKTENREHEIRAKIQELDNKLDTHAVYNRNGRPSIR